MNRKTFKKYKNRVTQQISYVIIQVTKFSSNLLCPKKKKEENKIIIPLLATQAKKDLKL